MITLNGILSLKKKKLILIFTILAISVIILFFNYHPIDVNDLKLHWKIWKLPDYPLLSGYRGATFDGQFVYFAPYQSNHGRHGFAVNYNTELPFNDINSWNVFDTSKISPRAIGFQGVVYDKNYVYFIPYFTNEVNVGTVMIRYNIDLPFNDVNSWDFYDGGFGAYEDGMAVDNYIYYSPHFDKAGNFNTIPLRYDTTKDFSDPTAWQEIKLGVNHSYIGNAFDGRFMYYSPQQTNEEFVTPIMIYDTTKDFMKKDSWQFLDITESGFSGVGFNGTHAIFASRSTDKIMFFNVENWELNYQKVDTIGYQGVIETDDAVYLVPYGIHGVQVNKIFIQISNSTKTFTPNISDGGYWGGVFDGQFVYFSPYGNGKISHGNVIRYDTNLPFDDVNSWQKIKLSELTPALFK